jgi:3-hydroxyacyl-[acyl-carrier-protein] dehydratase
MRSCGACRIATRSCWWTGRRRTCLGESIVGFKCVSAAEPHFQGHFPENPVMPGVLIIEAMAQTGAILMSKTLDADISNTLIYFMGVEQAKFRRPVRPG